MSRSARVRWIAVAMVLAAGTVSGGWWEAYQCDANFDLPGARAAALETVAAEPQSADAVAAALWWLGHVDTLWEPAAILNLRDRETDPELAFVLARIAAEIEERPPAGCLATAEVAGPFGSYSRLDIDRWVVPADSHLPPPGTPWRGPDRAFRLRLSTAAGRVSPPELMVSPGVYLAAWSVVLDEPAEGWLVVEARGSYNLEVDGHSVARLRDCGIVDPGVSWFAFNARPGAHRIRVEMAARNAPDVRLSLLDPHGQPLPVSAAERSIGPWAESLVEAAEPPAASHLWRRVREPEAPGPSVLLAAALARGRGDPRRQDRLLATALATDPDDPWLNLAAAHGLLTMPSGLDQEVAERRTRDHLRAARTIPLALLLERALATRQKRIEDEERLLAELVRDHRDDPRVLRLWLQEAVRRGWLPEAEEAMQGLTRELPDSRAVDELRLAVLENLERWRERNQLLEELADDGLSPRRIEQLAGSCFAERALTGLRALGRRVDDPGIDVAIVQLLLEREEEGEAVSELSRARARWGPLTTLNQLAVVAASAGGGDLDRALAEALESVPGDLNLRSLWWRRGHQAFFAPFRVDALEAAREIAVSDAGVDAVVVLDQAVERLFDDGSSLYYYHGLTRTLTPEGAHQASTLQQLPNALLLGVRIIKPDGTVLVPPELSNRNGTLVLNDVKEGDLVEEEYVAALPPSHPALRGHLSPYVYRFADPERAFGWSEYVILYPAELNVQVDGQMAGLEHESWQEGSLRGQRWTARAVPPVPAEPLAPPAQELLPWVTIGFRVSWEDVGDSLRDRVLAILRGTRELDAWADQLLAEPAPPPELLKRVADALFAEVEAGQADLELGWTAGESFSRRRGNRLAILAAVMLRAGWQVDLMLARPLPFAGSHLAVPSMEAFSLPILRLEHEGHALWVDLAEERSGIGHISPMLQGSDALRIPLWSAQASAGLEPELPAFANPELEDKIVVRAELAPTGSATVHFERRATGAEAEGLLARIREVPAEQESLLFSQLASNLFPGADRAAGGVSRDGDEVVLHLDFSLASPCTVSGDRMSCRHLVPAQPLVPVLAALPERRFPLILQLPVLQRYVLELVPPAGWSAQWPPRRLDSGWGSVSEVLEPEPGGLRSELSLSMPSQTVTAADYPAFARFCHAVDELLGRPVELRRGSR